jgi:hypothetical protein
VVIKNKPTTPPPAGAIATTTTVTSPGPTPPDAYTYVNAGQSATLTATVTANTGDSVPTGTVTFAPVEYPGGNPPPALSCTAALAAGKVQCKVNIAADTWGFTLYEATYTPTAGSDWTTSNSTQAGIDHKLVTWDITSTVVTAPAATVGDAVTLKSDTIDQPMDSLASAFGGPELVDFTANGVAISGCTNVAVTDTEPANADPDNVATCSYTPTTAGPVTIVAKYLGDDYALPSSGTDTLTVNN